MLAYIETGRGPPLVLLHAFPLDRRMWRQTATALAGRCRVITPDLRGFGQTPLAAGGFTIADLADDVVALLDALGLEKAAVGGMSMGGYVALALAARHPQRLSALILADTKAGADSSETREGREQAIALVQGDGVAAFVDRTLPKLLAPAASEALRAEVRTLALAQPRETVLGALAAMRDRPDRRADLPHIVARTLVVVGSEDAVTPPADARAMAAAIPGARLVELPGAGHLSNLETPAPFAAALSDFM